MAESDTHLPKKVFKAEKRSYIDDEKKHRGKKRKKKREKFRCECACYANLVQMYARDRMCANLRVCERKIITSKSEREKEGKNDEGCGIDDGRSSCMVCVCEILRK